MGDVADHRSGVVGGHGAAVSQQPAELAAASLHPRLGARQRQAQCLGGRALGVAVEIDQGDGLPVLVGKLINQRA